MPSIRDLAEQYAEIIMNHGTTPRVAADIASRIRGLKYTDSGLPLSTTDRDSLLSQIKSIILERGRADRILLKEGESSERFIQMIKTIRKELQR